MLASAAVKAADVRNTQQLCPVNAVNMTDNGVWFFMQCCMYTARTVGLQNNKTWVSASPRQQLQSYHGLLQDRVLATEAS
jgi:hypothetical protein